MAVVVAAAVAPRLAELRSPAVTPCARADWSHLPSFPREQLLAWLNAGHAELALASLLSRGNSADRECRSADSAVREQMQACYQRMRLRVMLTAVASSCSARGERALLPHWPCNDLP